MIKLIITVFLLLSFLISPVSAKESKKALPPCVKTDCDCKDFKTQEEAQKVLDAFPGDPHRLDRDKDGIACERNGNRRQ